jgi:rare lipoprotein A
LIDQLASVHLHPSLRLAAAAVSCLALAHCATSGVQTGRMKDPKYGVYTSPRVVAGTDAIDPAVSRRGVYMVGRPYKVAGKRYVPAEDRSYSRVGMASWYGDDFHGRLTANGEVFDMHDISAAHATMPLPSYARVTNLDNGNSIVVRVNDRGPYHGGRVIDVSKRAAELLDFESRGVGHVKVDYLGRAQQTGSDVPMLLATLRTDGSKAPLPASLGGPGNTMVAQAAPEPEAEPAAGAAAAEPVATPVARPVLVAYRDTAPTVAKADMAGSMPSSWLAGRASTAEATPVPPERPFDLETIPNAATPIPADAKPLQIPAATAAVPLPPQRIPLPPQRSADAGTEASPLDGGTIRLKIADVVGGAGEGPATLAYADEDSGFSMSARGGYFIDAGLYGDKEEAQTLSWVLSQSGDVTVTSVAGQNGTYWRVKAGPYAARGDANAAAILARSAGAADAAVLD